MYWVLEGKLAFNPFAEDSEVANTNSTGLNRWQKECKIAEKHLHI
jgi:hypothetical protein